MAIIRIVPTDSGANVEYWRIEEIHDDIACATLNFTLRGYVNEAARRGGLEFVYEYPLVLSGENYSPAPGLGYLYASVKAMPEFAAATDG